MDNLGIIILAGGEGKRMRSKLPKVLHPICGKPMIQYVMETTNGLDPAIRVIVVGHKADEVKAFLSPLLGPKDKIVLQPQQLGTGDAVKVGLQGMDGFRGDLLILGADTPFLSMETLSELVAYHREEGAKLTLLTTRLPDPTGYGRLIRGEDGEIKGIIEDGDATGEEITVREVNAGVYCFCGDVLSRVLPKLRNNNVQKELYLTDVVSLLVREGERVVALEMPDPDEVLGINDLVELSRAQEIQRKRILTGLMRSGVRIMDPATTFIDSGVKVGRDTVILPFCMISGDTSIGEDCLIGPQTYIFDTKIGDGVSIMLAIIRESVIGSRSRVGPFSNIRPGSKIGERVSVGNFVELKKATIEEGAKMNHLAYIGDAFIGKGVNIGAGTITCNYDGEKKHPTTIEDEAFVGSNAALVAPVRIGKGAVIGAGSTITEDVPPYALGISRVHQRNIDRWRFRRRKGGK
jgi:bifunctional UDP-N-acetylglucosamine pyrophosphorylase/glucosamine-1-phosphate N-acetyltransferase